MAEIYRSDIVRVDLDHALLRKYVGAILATGDKLGNRFGAEVYRDGKPVDVTGCGVTAYFMRPGEDAIVLNGMASGSVAYVDLAQACYSKASSFTLTIKISYGGATTALRVIDGYILLTQTDELIDPGETVPTLDDIFAQIAKMEEVIGRAEQGITLAFAVANDARTAVKELSGVTAPPIIPTATGEVVTVSDSANRPLAGLRLYGKTTQDGTPTPNSPVPLVNVGAGGSIRVKACGANLLRREDLMNGLQVSQPGDAAAIVDGYGWRKEVAVGVNGIEFGKTYELPCLRPGVTYTLSFLAWNSGTGSYYVDCYPDTLPETRITLTATPTRYTWTFSSDKADMANAQIRVHGENTGTDTLIVRVVDIKLEVGSAATPFESYADGGSVTASTPNGLPGIPVSSSGNYTDENGQQWICDEKDYERGVYVQRIDRYSIADIQDVVVGKSSSGVPYADLMFGVGGYGVDSPIICNCYTQITYGDAGIHGAIKSFDSALTVYDDRFTDKQTAINLLTNMGFVAYVIKPTPTETPLSADELSAYRAMTSQKPNTTVYNDAGAGMAVDYIADTQRYIDGKLAAIAAATLNT